MWFKINRTLRATINQQRAQIEALKEQWKASDNECFYWMRLFRAQTTEVESLRARLQRCEERTVVMDRVMGEDSDRIARLIREKADLREELEQLKQTTQ